MIFHPTPAPSDGGAAPPPRLQFLRLNFPLLSLLLLPALASPSSARAASPAGWAPNLTFTATWQDNATNANRSSDLLSALSLAADASATRRLALARHDSLLLTARASAESVPQFSALDRAAFAVESAWRRKFGLGPQAPVLTAALALEAGATRESARAGLGATLAVSLRQRLDDATVAELSQTFSRFSARESVFARTAAETTLAVTRTFGERWSLAAAIRWRSGDILAYATPPRPELVALARARTPVTTFGRAMVAYSLPDARTLAGRLALACALDAQTSLDLAVEYRDTAKASAAYVNRLVSASVGRQF